MWVLKERNCLKKELGIFTFGDLLHHFPFRHVDRTKFYTAREATADLPYIQLKGQIRSLVMKGDKRKKYLTGRFEDSTEVLNLNGFREQSGILSSIKLNTEYILFGKPTEFNGQINIIHPELELSEAATGVASNLQAVYNTTEKLKSKGLDSRGFSDCRKFPTYFSELFPRNSLAGNYQRKSSDEQERCFCKCSFSGIRSKTKKAEVWG